MIGMRIESEKIKWFAYCLATLSYYAYKQLLAAGTPISEIRVYEHVIDWIHRRECERTLPCSRDSSSPVSGPSLSIVIRMQTHQQQQLPISPLVSAALCTAWAKRCLSNLKSLFWDANIQDNNNSGADDQEANPAFLNHIFLPDNVQRFRDWLET